MVVGTPRWLADEMLGRLARYLRFFGHDTEYVRGGGDAAIGDRARAEGRTLLTRDRQLARRVDGAVWIGVTGLDDQLRAVRARFPEYPYTLVFDRCTVCNGRLDRVPGEAVERLRPAVPPSVRASGGPIFACVACGHPYWEGTHTAHLRAHLARTFSEP